MGTYSFAYAHRNLTSLQPIIGQLKRHLTELDLSNNNISDLSLLSQCPNLSVIVLNNNKITDTSTFPLLLNLKTLWLAHNSINNIHRLLTSLEKSCPNLTDLLLLGNECCPSYLNAHTKREYTEYRHFVLSRLSSLKVLDCQTVTDEERFNAIKFSCFTQKPRASERRRDRPLLSLPYSPLSNISS
ncbi:hypothetical protein GEMRC1_003202 [Eukaryota sp. GEM-RC1]